MLTGGAEVGEEPSWPRPAGCCSRACRADHVEVERDLLGPAARTCGCNEVTPLWFTCVKQPLPWWAQPVLRPVGREVVRGCRVVVRVDDGDCPAAARRPASLYADWICGGPSPRACSRQRLGGGPAADSALSMRCSPNRPLRRCAAGRSSGRLVAGGLPQEAPGRWSALPAAAGCGPLGPHRAKPSSTSAIAPAPREGVVVSRRSPPVGAPSGRAGRCRDGIGPVSGPKHAEPAGQWADDAFHRRQFRSTWGDRAPADRLDISPQDVLGRSKATRVRWPRHTFRRRLGRVPGQDDVRAGGHLELAPPSARG